jgi:hypothetical protein
MFLGDEYALPSVDDIQNYMVVDVGDGIQDVAKKFDTKQLDSMMTELNSILDSNNEESSVDLLERILGIVLEQELDLVEKWLDEIKQMFHLYKERLVVLMDAVIRIARSVDQPFQSRLLVFLTRMEISTIKSPLEHVKMILEQAHGKLNGNLFMEQKLDQFLFLVVQLLVDSFVPNIDFGLIMSEVMDEGIDEFYALVPQLYKYFGSFIHGNIDCLTVLFSRIDPFAVISRLILD